MRDFDDVDEFYEYIGVDTSTPYDELQHFDLSKLKFPKIDLPKLDLPQIDLPKIDLPKIDLPKIDLPKIDLPFDKKEDKKDKKDKKDKNGKTDSKKDKNKKPVNYKDKESGRYGREWKDHKWIDRKRDENGKWIYDYGDGFPDEGVGSKVPLKDTPFNDEVQDVTPNAPNKLSKITGLINDLGRLLISPVMDDKISAGQNFLGRLEEIGLTAAAKLRQVGKRRDEETDLPLKDPGDKSTWEDDVKNVNPGWNNKDQGSQMNCPNCTVAMDLRQRGYEVSAKEDIDGCNYPTLESLYKDGEMNVISVDYEGQTTTDAFYDAIKDEPEGSSGMIAVQWGDGPGNGGHVVNYVIENGEPMIYDGQCREKMPAYEYTDRSWLSAYMRTDNLEPNWDKVKEMVE